MSRIQYRKAVIADCPALSALKGEVWNTTYKDIYSDETLQNYDVYKNQLIFESIVANPDIELCVAEDDGEIVGLMTCGKPFRPFQDYRQEIGLLYIRQSHQRRGIGRHFLAIAREQVQSAGESAFIVAVNRQNINAIQFYLAMGAQPIAAEGHQLRLVFRTDA